METKNRKTALITGANNPRGIGAAIARTLAAEGAACFLNYIRRPGQLVNIPPDEIENATEPGMALYTKLGYQSADQLVEEIQSAGGQAAAWEADLVDPATIPTLFDKAEAAFGQVDILINNAAHCPDKDYLLDLSQASIDQTYAVNVRATMLLIAEYVRRYEVHGLSAGRIINISTGPAQLFTGQIAYGSSKAAVEAATRAIAPEIGPLGITLNTIAPGATQTGYIARASESDLIPTIPMRRLGEPEDIANTVQFLASDHASWLTGQVIRVTGGRDM